VQSLRQLRWRLACAITVEGELVHRRSAEHDIVAAINPATAVLKNESPPAPFNIKDKKEALFLLAHFLGDLHQPLHVGAVYLDQDGNPVNPDTGPGLDPNTETHGGNSIKHDHGNLHSEWDASPVDLGRTAPLELVQVAARVPSTPGSVSDWAGSWASDTVMASHKAFAGLAFSGDGPRHWTAQSNDQRGYRAAEDRLKRDQLAKAGARLAELLNTIWP
jgi:hypothetical protein